MTDRIVSHHLTRPRAERKLNEMLLNAPSGRSSGHKYRNFRVVRKGLFRYQVVER